MKKLSSLVLAAAIFATSSCSLQFMGDYRHICEKIVPGAYRGNFLGKGSNGPNCIPIDEADRLGREHDIAYDRSKTVTETKWADRAFAEIAKEIHPSLSLDSQKFMTRAITFFEGPLAKYFGNPSGLTRNSDDRYWQSYDDVYHFMKKSELPKGKYVD